MRPVALAPSLNRTPVFPLTFSSDSQNEKVAWHRTHVEQSPQSKSNVVLSTTHPPIPLPFRVFFRVTLIQTCFSRPMNSISHMLLFRSPLSFVTRREVYWVLITPSNYPQCVVDRSASDLLKIGRNKERERKRERGLLQGLYGREREREREIEYA
jgi:hypothetical protein